jgi:YggT family protein
VGRAVTPPLALDSVCHEMCVRRRSRYAGDKPLWWAALNVSSVRSVLSLVLFFQILGFSLFIFWLLLIARVVVEFIRSFSRDWRPSGITVVILEIIMSITDPPVKLLRRLIPQLTIGAVRFDLSIMVLLLVAFIGMQLAFGAAA